MDITNKMLMDLAGDAGIKGSAQLSEREIEGIQRKAENIKNKGDAEILAEIAALKDAIKKDRRAYEKQISAIKAMRPMMNKEQRARLDRIIALIEE